MAVGLGDDDGLGLDEALRVRVWLGEREPESVPDIVCVADGESDWLGLCDCDGDLVWLGERDPDLVADIVCVSDGVRDALGDELWESVCVEEGVQVPVAVIDCEGDPVKDAGHC